MRVRAAIGAAAILLLAVLPGPPAGAAVTPEGAAAEGAPVEMTAEEKADAEIGRRADEELRKQFPVVEDSPELPRIEAIVERLRPVTEKPRQTYQVAVIDSKDINSLAIPGGYLYFTTGLLEAVESDDELAAVAAHEMTHICLSHSRRLMGQDERYQKILGPLVLLSILSNSEAVSPGEVALVGSLVVQDAMNHYGRAAELEADQGAVRYLKESKQYHPVAMLTVLEGLARMESQRPPVDWGVGQTHPTGRERAAAVLARLEELGIAVERRRVTGSLVAEAARVTLREQEVGEVRLNGRAVFQPAAEVEGASPAARAERSAEVFNELLLSELQLLEVLVVESEGRAAIEARGETILTITEADAAFHEATVAGLAEQAMEAIRMGFREERIGRAY